MPPANAYQPGAQHGGFHNQPQQHQGGYNQGGYNQGQSGYPGGQQQQQGYGGQNNNGGNNQNDELEKLARKFLPRVLRKLEGCCTVM